MDNRQAKTEYIPISSHMIRADTRNPFDIFLKREGYYVLFSAKDRVFTKAKKQELIDSDIVSIYIDKRQLEAYRTYLLEYITSLLDDDSMPLEERAKAWANSAVQLGKELFEEKLPGAAFKQRYQRFEKLIVKTSGFLQAPQSLKELSNFISKGYSTYHHGIGTMVYTVNLMHEYGYEDFDILSCGMGALLHDIGKTELPEDILEKRPADLTADDKQIIALHPMVGARICSTFNLPTQATNCILFHHEREDGKGYPSRASGDDLPRHTKIVALSNKYDNLTRTQPYRRALSPFEALKYISKDGGFTNKDILKTFITILSRAEIVRE